MNVISRRIKTEWSHFESLNEGSRTLLLSFFLYLLAHPMLSIFINAYFWRQAGGLNLIIIYNLGFFVALPFAFYLNGLLLKKIHIKKMYLIGTALQGLAAVLAIFQTNMTLMGVGFFGLIYGFGAGFFWANKNFLSMVLTRGQNRVYFNALENTFATLFKTIIPIAVGWVIIYGETSQRYSVNFSYRLLIILSLVVLLVSGSMMFRSKIKDEFSGKLFLGRVSKTWKIARIYNITYQSMTGLNFFLPATLVLYLLGSEGVLGTVQSIASLASAATLYWVGRKLNFKDSPKVFFWITVINWLGAAFLAWNFSSLGVIIFMLVFILSRSLKWVTSYPTLMEIMDREDGKRDGNYQYAYVADNELFFNIGRILGVMVLVLFLRVSQDFALRFAPLVMASLQFITWVLLKKMAKEVSSSTQPKKFPG